MKSTLRECLMIRFHAYRPRDGMLVAKQKAKQDHIEYLQAEIDNTWNPFKRLRLLEELVATMNYKW